MGKTKLGINTFLEEVNIGMERLKYSIISAAVGSALKSRKARISQRGQVKS